MTPLLGAVLAYALGLLAGLRWLPPVWACATLAAAAIVALRAGGASPRGAVLVAFVAGGAAVGGVRGAAVREDCRVTLQDQTNVVLVGTPTSLPTEGAALPFRAATLRTGGDPCPAATVRLRPHARHLAVLDSVVHGRLPVVTVHGRWLAYPQRGGWPRAPVYAGSVVVDSVRPMVEPGAGRAGPVIRFRAAQQARLRALLPDRWGMAEALLLAQKSGLAQETRARFVASGLVHLLAISGMHVGLIAAGALLLGSRLGVPPRRARRLAVLLTAAYVLFLGAPSAALRALLQAVLLLSAAELQRPAEPFTLLAAAALGILIGDPMALLDPGFQLSFAGVAGLVAWRRPLAERLPRRWPAYVRDGTAAGVAASALTTPLAALHFGTASWIGIPGTLVAVPLLSAAIGGTLVALVVAAVTGTTSGPHAWFADVPLRLLDGVAEALARVPGGHGYLPASTILAALGAAAVFILASRSRAATALVAPPVAAGLAAYHAWTTRRRRHALRVGVAGGMALVVAAWSPVIIRAGHRDVEIHAIDVGQGDAFAIRTPRGRWVLVDAGPRTARSDAGRDRVVPYLLKHGARRIDVLILTHPDADHIGGAAAVLDAFDVGVVVDPGLPAGKSTFVDLLAAARGARTRWVAGRAGVGFSVDGVDFAMLYPLHELDASVTANDFSVVFRLEFGRFAALFTGDAPAAVEDELVARHGAGLRAALLKVGHHGSTTSTGAALLDAARPHLALVSAGRRNRYGHPAPSVLRRLEQHQVRVLRTDELGNILVRASRSGTLEARAR